MIKKKGLLEFLDKVESKALSSVDKKYVELIKNEEARIMISSGYDVKLNEAQKEFNKCAANIEKLLLNMRDNKEVRYTKTIDYNGPINRMNNFIGICLIKHVKENCNFQVKKLAELKSSRDKELEAVRNEYSKVKVYCRNLGNGAKVATYLKQLGFDISNLEERENKSLIAQVDISKLFVCGDKK